MAVCNTIVHDLSPGEGLNASERARQKLAPLATTLLGHGPEIGRQVESVFSKFWQLARRADDMVDYSTSSDLKWLSVVQSVFALCSNASAPPPRNVVGPEAWLATVSHLFELMKLTCKGEVDDLLLCKRPSEPAYGRMVLMKTGVWFAGRIACAAVAADCKDSKTAQDLQEYGNLASMAYQIRNDIRDIGTEGKDIAIGKMNYPSILLFQAEPSLFGKKRIPSSAYREYGVMELAEKRAALYEERCQKIMRSYDCSLELFTRELCSSG